ncbi:hypothetical protein Tgr7_2036 [Thioalkalivibrio sulfidiphilus HL-EbGr7]|uniref:Uncharacterized protein n=1 Tax=Thioalkalivibrio sulfidiphilus (strain HL-EbGR7) TaxID=396588 RepID=B8GTM2_THISH|nr:hypothetical protein Tgr7_2036 [Thioalkalivibrio sulfidiphilus HL-EbGr7]
MIDLCQYCGHYGYLRPLGRVYLCGQCHRRHACTDAPGTHQALQETQDSKVRPEAR